MLLLCDLDDTLLDRTSTFEGWATAFARDQGLDPGAIEALVEMDGRGYREREDFVTLVNARFAVDPPLTASSFRASFAPLFECSRDVASALATARGQGWKIVIVTNGDATQLHKIEAAGLEEHVDAVCVSKIEGFHKPDVRLLTIAAERVGEPLDGAWFIGDNPETDIAAAANAGIRSVWISTGDPWPRTDFSPTALAATFADAVASALAEDGRSHWHG